MRSTTDGIELKFELVCGMALGKWSDRQMLAALGELGELSAALAGYIGGNRNKHAVLREIVDVKIVLRQLEVMFDVTPEEVEVALDRLKALIEGS